MSLGRHQPRRWPDGDRAGCAGLFRCPALHAPLQAPCSFPRLRPSEALPSVAVRTHAPLQGSGCQDHRRELGGCVERDQLGPPPCPLRGCGSAHRSGLAAPQDPPFCPVAGGLQGPSQPCSAAWLRATGRPPPPRDRRHGLAPLISGAVAAPFLRGLLDHFSSFLSRSASRGWETRHVGLSVRKRG